jgi:phosphoribosylamine--glycine ligase
MRILVVGSGGREHALVVQLRKSPRVREVFCAPGNGGIERDARCIAVSPLDNDSLINLARNERVDLVVVGPEAPLASGIVDQFVTHGISILGPRKAAARLESSKVFAKEFMTRHGIPTADFVTHTDAATALSQLDSQATRYPIVVKADGLAGGKGVTVARSREEARDAVQSIMLAREFGSAGDRIVLEECLEGVEASFIVFTDGETILPAVAARDHKTVYDGDRGPNTGGMGAYSTASILDPELEAEIIDRIVRPVIEGMRSEGNLFQGMLYTGLMLTSRGPRVLEFNVRMGDPEAQVILPRLKSDFALLCEALCNNRLATYQASWSGDAAVCVVLASGGYPGAYEKGKPISGLDMAAEDESVRLFHSGTRRENGRILTDGGRVLGVTAVAGDLSSAIISAYEAVNKIRFEGMHYRRDIGARGLQNKETWS